MKIWAILIFFTISCINDVSVKVAPEENLVSVQNIDNSPVAKISSIEMNEEETKEIPLTFELKENTSPEKCEVKNKVATSGKKLVSLTILNCECTITPAPNCSAKVQGPKDEFGTAELEFTVTAAGKISNPGTINVKIKNLDDPPRFSFRNYNSTAPLIPGDEITSLKIKEDDPPPKISLTVQDIDNDSPLGFTCNDLEFDIENFSNIANIPLNMVIEEETLKEGSELDLQCTVIIEPLILTGGKYEVAFAYEKDSTRISSENLSIDIDPFKYHITISSKKLDNNTRYFIYEKNDQNDLGVTVTITHPNKNVMGNICQNLSVTGGDDHFKLNPPLVGNLTGGSPCQFNIVPKQNVVNSGLLEFRLFGKIFSSYYYKIIDASSVPTNLEISYQNSTGKEGVFGEQMEITPTLLNKGGANVLCSINPPLPNGLSIDNDCVIRGAPNVIRSHLNSYQVTYKVTVSNLIQTKSDDITLTIKPAKPNITFSANDLNLPENTYWSFGQFVSATGEEVICTLTQESDNLPDGLELNQNQCAIYGTPTTVSSLKTIKIRAENKFQKDFDEQNLRLTISAAPNLNDRPVITIDSSQTTTTKEDAPLSVSFKISDVDSTLECTDTYLKADYDTSKISSHSFSGSNNNCSVKLTPALTKQDTSVAVTITVSDNDPTDPKSAVASFTLNITDIKPSISFSPNNVITNPFLGNISQELKITPAINAGGSTVSDCTIFPALRANLFISKSNCEITGIPSASLSKTEYNVTLKTAAGLSVEGKVFIEITDRPPTVSDISPTIPEDTEVSIDLSYTDLDGHKASLCELTNLVKITGSCVCKIPSGETRTQCTATIQGELNEYGVGIASFNYTITANGVPSTPAKATVTIIPEDDRPTLSLSPNPLTLSETENYKDLTITISDVDSSYSCSNIIKPSSNTTSIGDISDISSGPLLEKKCSVRFSRNSPQKSSETINVSIVTYAYDDLMQLKPQEDKKDLVVNVAHQDTAPVGILSEVQLEEDTPKTVELLYDDVDGDNADFCNVTLPVNPKITAGECKCNIPTGETKKKCTVTIQGIKDFDKMTSFEYTVAANGSPSLQKKVDVTITPKNDQPVIAIDSSQTTTTKEDAPLSVSFKISDVDSTLECTDTYLKADYDTSKISSHSFSGSNNNCSVKLTPALTKQDTLVAVSITVSDKDPTDPKSALASFSLNITDIKMPPVLTLNPETISVDLKQTVPKVSVTISDQDSDLNCASSITVIDSSNTTLISPNQITLSNLSGNAPSWTCSMNLTPNSNIADESTIKLSLKDESGNTVEKSLKLTVKPIAPTISFSQTSFLRFEGDDLNLNPIMATISENGARTTCSTFSGKLPTGLQLDSSSCRIIGIPSVAPETTKIQIVAINIAGSSTPFEIAIEIKRPIKITTDKSEELVLFEPSCDSSGINLGTYYEREIKFQDPDNPNNAIPPTCSVDYPSTSLPNASYPDGFWIDWTGAIGNEWRISTNAINFIDAGTCSCDSNGSCKFKVRATCIDRWIVNRSHGQGPVVSDTNYMKERSYLEFPLALNIKLTSSASSSVANYRQFIWIYRQNFQPNTLDIIKGNLDANHFQSDLPNKSDVFANEEKIETLKSKYSQKVELINNLTKNKQRFSHHIFETPNQSCGIGSYGEESATMTYIFNTTYDPFNNSYNTPYPVNYFLNDDPQSGKYLKLSNFYPVYYGSNGIKKLNQVDQNMNNPKVNLKEICSEQEFYIP